METFLEFVIIIRVVRPIPPEELYTLVDCPIFNFFVFSFTKYVNKSSNSIKLIVVYLVRQQFGVYNYYVYQDQKNLKNVIILIKTLTFLSISFI